MNEVKWNDSFNIGVDIIDKAHEKLFSIVGKLITLNEETDKQRHACQEGIKFLKNYTIQHFAEEEDYMNSINYNEYAIHKSLHDNMRSKTLPALERELERRNYSIESVRHFLGICVGWLNSHVMIEDHAITGQIPNKWIHHSSEDEIASLDKAITQAVYDLFRVNAQIVSEHYSGEDFSAGNMLCYRLDYLSHEGKLIHVFLTYEERLALHTLGTMLGRSIKAVDDTVAYTIKILSQQFVGRVGTHFVPQNKYRFKSSNLLTFDQILQAFDKEYPPYSLLFNTGGKGYFAFCIK